MQSFKDAKGRQWVVSINGATLKRIEQLLGLDLFEAIYDTKNPLKVSTQIDIIYAICKKQADGLGVTDEEFGEEMYGDVLGNAQRAFEDAIVNFFTDSQKREAMKQVIEKSRIVQTIATQHMRSQVERLQPESIAKQFIDISGNVPESSESIQENSPSANSIA